MKHATKKFRKGIATGVQPVNIQNAWWIKKTTRGRVLIADDDEAFRTATTAFLRRQGFDCESARDSSTATEKLRDADFELLISDINMPGNAGLEFVEKLPEIAAALPVILLTGHPWVQSAARSVRLRVAAYLVKPCDAEELLTLSEQAIANYRAYRAVSSNRSKIETWARDLAQIEDVLRNQPNGAPTATIESYLNSTLSNILSVLVDLKKFTEAIAAPASHRKVLEQVTLHRALEETIAVLEKTKQSFKSKELGELRKRLEALLNTPPAGEPRKDY